MHKYNDLIPIYEWLPSFNKNKLLIIAGPCSIETEYDTINIFKEIKNTNIVDIIRAGIWKPRTKPGSFEGSGIEGLKWLNKAKDIYNMPIAIEVANASHVKEAIKYNVDIIWIGARTTVNPFSMQEIADVLNGIDIPVMIKNPVNPDLDLWIGGIERIYNAGIKKIAAIHRGFSLKDNTPFRNMPLFDIVNKLSDKIPNLPIICDPSHIAGNSNLISFIAQKSIEYNKTDGLMIECHSNPEKAWTDAKQQITPKMLLNIINAIKKYSDNDDFIEINVLRDKINNIDYDLLNKIAKRMQLSKLVGKYKKHNKISIQQPDYWKEMLSKKIQYSNTLNLNENFIKIIMQMIHSESVEIQKYNI
ncbi:MAG: bifunctional 3-deoxy-7-phosphoheptulonate synthase/chorismate mutase type II [Bacteroides sp.]|nr:MAG: bifunctional 3-deoxy-7-phosphoheptulonate synthase/chorismate mutase type II [Bacteroides sp.]